MFSDHVSHYLLQKMSRSCKTSNWKQHKPANEGLTRRSARLHNLHSNVLKCKIVLRNEMEKLQRNTKCCPVLTCSKRKFAKCESINVGTTTTDSDESIVKVLTYSSSDSSASCKRVKRFKMSNKCSYDQNEPVEKKKIINEQISGYNLRSSKVIEGRGQLSNSTVTKCKHGYNLRRKSPRFKRNDCEAFSCVTVKSKHINEGRYSLRKSSQVIGRGCELLNSTVLKNGTSGQQSTNLRRKSPRLAKKNCETSKIVQSTESDSEVLEVEKGQAMTKKPYKTTKKENKNEKKKTSSRVGSLESKITEKNCVSIPFSLSRDQKNDDKKRKVGKRGTLARKRELRAMLEKQDEGYEDDAFEGTPFRNRIPLIKCNLSPVILDMSTQFDEVKDFKTPCNNTPVNRLRPAGPLSSGTSESDTMSPGLLNTVNRSYIDCYVSRLKKRKILLGGGNAKIKCRTPLSKKPCRIIESKSFRFDSSLQKSAAENENSEDDYYWSDMEL